VLLPLLVTLVLFAFGTALVAKVTQVASRRLGLDVLETLEWLGLAEEPVDELKAWRSGHAKDRSRTHNSSTSRRRRLLESAMWGQLSGAMKRGA
jgi:hypothetical protein